FYQLGAREYTVLCCGPMKITKGSLMDMQVGNIVAAIGGLGTAAFGLVDASKAFWGGVNNIGFGGIRDWVTRLVPATTVNGLARDDVIATLRENWFTGTPLVGQKAIAKSLVKLNFNAKSAAQMAGVTGMDAAT